ncbi:hypothetical protein [Okeania sp. KiyG1]|uniref:hypothetical protein n=1 Tax=Okeania sp. KiyG1 TaxID=2720165 RepID=UPI001924B01D|nr:hypothetical protein [Okeania sp. KiyG1]GGA15427.1 hypothetical protein CYANOKiyG1_29450 [Okeania sp. KiyG1]
MAIAWVWELAIEIRFWKNTIKALPDKDFATDTPMINLHPVKLKKKTARFFLLHRQKNRDTILLLGFTRPCA